MRRNRKHKVAVWIAIVVITLAIALGIFNISKSEMGVLENVVKVVVTPVQKLFTGISNGISDFFGYFAKVDGLHNEIAALKKENADLKESLTQSEIYSKENEKLKELLDLKNTNSNYDVETVEIISRNPSNWYNTFTINKGAKDGIAINQPVVSSGNTLIGRISDVGATWATVKMLTEADHSAGAQIVRSEEYGVCEGDTGLSQDGKCKITFISKNANILVGDIVVTSGLGGIYPKGLIIGKIEEIRPDTQGISQYAIVTPEANIMHSRVAFVLKNSNE